MAEEPTYEELLEKCSYLETIVKTHRSLIENSSDLFYRTDLDGKITFASPSVYRLSGYTSEEAIGMQMAEEIYLLPEERESFLAELNEKGNVTNFESQLIRKDGSIWWASSNAHFYKDRHGNILGVEGTTRDITDKRAAEDDLQLMKHVVQKSPIVLFRWQAKEGWPVDYVSGNVRIFGYQPESLLSGKIPFAKIVHPDDLVRVADEVAAYSRRGVEDFSQTYRLVTPSGEIRWIDDWTNVIRDKKGHVTHYQGVVLDVTDRKQVETDLWIAQSVVDNSSLPIFRIDEKARFQYANAAACRHLGYSQKELLGMSIPDIDTNWTADFWENEGLPFLRQHNEGHFESVHRRKDGNEFPVEIHSYRINYEGEFYFVSTAIDITERKRNSEELHRLRNYLSNIIDSMPSALVGVNQDGRVTLWNHRMAQVTGVSPDRARGKNLADLMPWMASEMNTIKESIRTKIIRQEPKRLRKSEKGNYYEDVTIYPLVTNGVDGAVIRIDDVTETVRLEEMMIQSEKMLSVGGLAAGMAHEINNPLAGIMQNANVIANRLGDGLHIPANQQAAEAAGTTMDAIEHFMQIRGIPGMIDTIKTSGQRVAETVSNMLSFARKSETVASFHRLDELIDKTLVLAATDYDLKKQYDFKQIETIKAYAKNLPSVPCESAKIQQVLLNILRNGAQAMQEAQTPTPCFTLRTHFDDTRKMVCIEIEDNGPGIDEATRRRVFEPFFTTKPVGVGTGLGLSVSYFIITENHGGELAVESHPGSGTTFTICLPLEKEA